MNVSHIQWRVQDLNLGVAWTFSTGEGVEKHRKC